MIEDHRNMGWRIARLVAFQIAEQDVAEPRHRPNRQAIRLACQRWQGVIGAKDIGRAVDQMQMVALAECHCSFPCSALALRRLSRIDDGRKGRIRGQASMIIMRMCVVNLIPLVAIAAFDPAAIFGNA